MPRRISDIALLAIAIAAFAWALLSTGHRHEETLRADLCNSELVDMHELYTDAKQAEAEAIDVSAAAVQAEAGAKDSLELLQRQFDELRANYEILANETLADPGVQAAILGELRRQNPCACVLRACDDGSFRFVELD